MDNNVENNNNVAAILCSFGEYAVDYVAFIFNQWPPINRIN